MTVKLIGKQTVDFTNNANERITGVTLFVAFASDGTEGLRTEKLFAKSDIEIPECKVGDMLELGFTMRGKLEKITKA